MQDDNNGNIKLTFGSVFGNYEWQATATADAKTLAILAPLGALQVGQRTPSSTAEKLIAGYDKRPKGFQRNTIPFTMKGADILKSQLARLEIADGVFLDCAVDVKEYIPTAAEKKYAAERKLLTEMESRPVWTKFLASLGFDETTSHENGEYSVALCEAYAKKRAALAKAAEDAALAALDATE